MLVVFCLIIIFVGSKIYNILLYQNMVWLKHRHNFIGNTIEYGLENFCDLKLSPKLLYSIGQSENDIKSGNDGELWKIEPRSDYGPNAYTFYKKWCLFVNFPHTF